MSKVTDGADKPEKTGFKAKASSVLKSIQKRMDPKLKAQAMIAGFKARQEKSVSQLVDKQLSRKDVAPSPIAGLDVEKSKKALKVMGAIDKTSGPSVDVSGEKALKVTGAIEKDTVIAAPPETPNNKKALKVMRGSQKNSGGMGGR